MVDLVPRVYQSEATARALISNLIIRSDTGTGKTFIAILLLREIAATPSTSSLHRIAVFLTPTAALVDQQARAIESSTHLRVKGIVGADGVDYWKRERWIEQIESVDVVVMTPQIWLNVLSNAYWKLSQVSLIVFDESHHASKKHPYAEIMRTHYHPLKARDSSLVPKILGLTASPIYNAKNPQKLINELEATLDSRILEISKISLDGAVFSSSPKAQEELVEHDAPPESTPTLPAHQNCLDTLAETGKLDKRARDRIEKCKELFGLPGVEAYLSILAKDCDVPEVYNESHFSTVSPTFSSLAPKTLALIERLHFFNTQRHSHAIVFVEQRHHASILSNIISRIPSLGWIKAGHLVGHGGRGRSEEGESQSAKDLGMEIKKQKETVEKFRNGTLNLLVATRIAEEGLDFQQPACNLVVRFDTLDTITGYIQSRGRARAAEALFVVLAERSSDAALRYQTYVRQEAQLKEYYAQRPDDVEVDEPELDNLPTYSTPAGALLTYQSSIPLLASFCSLLNRTDPFTPIQKPMYRIMDEQPSLVAEVTLPKIAALSEHRFVSQRLPTKKAARQQTAFDVCVALHRAGALDDHLLPLRETFGVGARDADGREVDRTEAKKLIPISPPNVYGDVGTSPTGWLHTIEVKDKEKTRSFGILCGRRQASPDEADVFGRGDYQATVEIVSTTEIEWNSTKERDERIKQLREFNRTICLVLLNRRIGDEDFYALWCPLDNSGKIDFDAVETAFLPFDSNKANSDTLVVVPFARPRFRIGQFLRVRDDVSSSSPTSQIERDPPKTKVKFINRYPDYFQYVGVAYAFHELKADSQDPIVEFEALTLSPHRLSPGIDPAIRLPRSSRILPAKMCRLTTISESTWSLFAMIPAINRLISSRTLAEIAIERLKLPEIAIDRLVEALTTPSAGLGFDYQYLETLGDSCLKLVTSIHIYLEYPAAEEGRLTTLRQNSVDNRFLRQRSIESGLANFVSSNPLRWSTFVPETSDGVEVSKDGSTTTRKVGRKVLSDTVESTLGAALLSGGLAMALETGTKLGLCFDGTTRWEDRPSARRLLDVEPARAAPSLTYIERVLGYTFKTQGHLLRQALTHRSFRGNGYCYEREEYLGDALLDYWLTSRLFPLAVSTTPRFLTFRRAVLVSNTVLSLLAVRKLQIHKSILQDSPLLDAAMREAAKAAEKIEWSEVIEGDLIWLWVPPKVLGDVIESLLAVVFIDSHFSLDTVFSVLDRLYEDILPFLESEKERRDPYSRLLMFKDSHQCDYLKLTLDNPFPFTPTPTCLLPLYTSTIIHHDLPISSATSSSRTVSRQMASRDALKAFEERGMKEGKGKAVICDCRERKMREKKQAKARAEREKAEEQGVKEGEEEESEGTEESGIGSTTEEEEFQRLAGEEVKLEDVEDEEELEEVQETEERKDGNEEFVNVRRVREY